jgi:anaerobic selenocysteine-containing dehydrogenase
MAEAHPVGFQWVMEARARGAAVIHVDPRFSRTSAVADLHVPIRAGADIAFVGGLINYVLQHEKYFRDYVLAFTNAPVILTEEFADTEDLDGVFSGLDAENRVYDYETWRYQGDELRPASGERGIARDRLRPLRQAARGEAHGSGGAAAHPRPDTDPTLQHPRCVFQVLKRHFARYTPEMVAKVAGVPEDLFTRVCRLVTENSGPDRTTAFVYSLGWTQHTVGVQYIRTAAILQALPGNIGRPGGGAAGHHGPREPVPAQRQPAGIRRVPLRGDHVPADRAPHGGRDVPVPAVPGRAAAGVLLRGVAGAGGRAGPGAHGLGDDHLGPQRGRGAGDGHRADEAARRRRPAAASDRAALALGAERPHGRGRGQRARAPVPGPERAHPGGEGAGPGYPPGRRPRGPARRRLVLDYQQRAGITGETGTEV